MNILFIAYSPLFAFAGGVQRVTTILANELRTRGYNVYYLCGISQTIHNDEISQYPPSFYMNKKLEESYDNTSLELYHKYLNELKIDIVILQYPIFGKSLFFLKNTPANIPLISFFHNQPFYCTKDKSLKDKFRSFIRTQKEKILFNTALQHSTKFCFLSEKFYSRLPNYLRLKYHNKLLAINNPNSFSVDNTFYEKEYVVLLVSRLSEGQKNIHDFIDMWSLLSLNNPNWKAYIVGDGPDRFFLEKYAKTKNIKNLFFEGIKNNVTDYYKKAQFICMTSNYEGWGMVLTEGMAYGCIPCVYGTYEAAYDIIDNGKCGFITTPYKPSEMVNKIQSLIDNEDLRRQFSENARKKVLLFTPDKIVDQWEQLFCSLDIKKHI